MITFICGLCILFFGYLFYSKYTESQFEPDSRPTPANSINDGVDYVPLNKWKNMLIQLLNIAGLGPILGAIQGVLFGPVAFILIPLGCVFMGSVHDYFAGMISLRNKGLQIPALIKKYLGEKEYKIFMVIVCTMLIFVAAVFVYTSGDIIAGKFFNETDFSLANPLMIAIYGIIAAYYILATLFPIDKIIGKLYPYFGALLLIGTGLILVKFMLHGCSLENIDFSNLNQHPKHIPIIPMFFMTISCGLLSGFHSTQSTLISRTLDREKEGKNVFYGMMCVESLIGMIWAAAAMHVYDINIVPKAMIGTVNVVNIITTHFVPSFLAIIVTLAVVILPITSGDTALRSLRITLSDGLSLNQKPIANRLYLMLPIVFILIGIIFLAKTHSDSFAIIWRYFTFFNQLIAIPTFFYATLYLYQHKKNYYMTMIPGLFYVFITMSFIFNAKIGFGLNLYTAEIVGFILTVAGFIYLKNKMKKTTISKLAENNIKENAKI
ncbi:MAG: carbon starvation CstA family protein [Candidatus Gastranaerophilales bacterium]|nr:carbon starvation CstA family protein [Candidatus Gastranaerophilales bacterium]